MINKLVKYFFIFTILFIFGFFTFLTFDSDFRRYSFSRIIAAYKLYQIISLQGSLKNGDVEGASKKLLNFIKVSEKIANGKSSLLYGIYDASKLVESKVSSKEDYIILKEVFTKLVEQDPTLYEARIWLAKSMRYTNIDKALEHINEAIKISPAQDQAYRLAIKIAQEKDDKDLAIFYCNKYKNSKFGGNLPRYNRSFFGGNIITKMGVEFLPEKEISNIYTHSGLQLNNFEHYEFTPAKPIDVDGFKIYLSFLPGIQIELSEISVVKSEFIEKIPISNISATSESAYIKNDKNEHLSFLILNEENEILKIKFKDKINSLNKIILKMKISKLDLASNSLCR
jgi:tetratricopeptide (TPR) repeat protein